MSLHLNCGTKPNDLWTKALNDVVLVGDYEISLEDFCELVLYVLTNADLADIAEDDPRMKLLEEISKLTVVEGWNSFQDENAKRLGYPESEESQKRINEALEKVKKDVGIA